MSEFLQLSWRFLGTDQGKLLVGFALTTIAGGALAYVFQSLSWRRQARLDLYRQRYADGSLLLEQLSSMVDRRYFRLQRLIWVVGDGAPAEKVAEREREYFETVVEWNEKLRSVHNRIRLLIGETEALQFLDYADDFRPNDPQSLHYRFVKAHRQVLQAKTEPTLAQSAKEEVDRLNWSVSRFAYDTTTLFMRRASSLALLRPASPETAESKARQTSGPTESLERS
jgi:hypothetical protein